MSRAVIFTHLDERNRLEDPNAIKAFYQRRGAFFRSCLRCPNISIVFVYSSYGVEKCVNALLKGGKDPKIPMDVLENEQRVDNALQMVLDRAALHVGGAHAAWLKEHGPKFVFIGVRELAAYLNRLMRIDRRLVENFAHRGQSTYDSPKNIEAMIRIARQSLDETIIRVDADVQVNKEAIDVLLARTDLCRADADFEPYWWFSGGYCGNFAGDPVNIHAVRQHWLVTPETRRNKGGFTLVEGAHHFLADIAEVGATQFDGPHQPSLSRAAEKLVADRKYSKRRASAQVISGAGLVASAAAVERLPPFMNAPAMVVWIDDHLKRLLHEAIGDMTPDDPERLEAYLQQDRYPEGIDDRDPVDFLKKTHDYFERLLNGCLMEATILKRPGEAGPLADCVHDVVLKRLNELTTSVEQPLRHRLVASAKERLADVLTLWKEADYGDENLRNWAEALDQDVPRQEAICGRVADIGLAYVRLCLDWEHHVAAIHALKAHDAYWLFTKPRADESAVVAPLPMIPITTPAPTFVAGVAEDLAATVAVGDDGISSPESTGDSAAPNSG